MQHIKILQNFMSLSLLQLSSYLLPFITVPFLARTLTTEHYGIILYAMSLMLYINIFCDYGFSITGIKSIALHKNKPEFSETISAITMLKFILFVIALIFTGCVLLYFQTQYWYIYLISFLSVIYNVLFPSWFFQGIEQMHYITVVNIASRIIAAILIVLFVNDRCYFYIPVFTLLVNLVCILYIQLVLRLKFSIKYTLPSKKSLKYHLKDGLYIFISNIIGSSYCMSNSVLLGIMTNNHTYVAYYALAEKLLAAMNGIYGGFFSALFPQITQLLHSDLKTGIKYIKRTVLYVFIISLGISIVISIFAKYIILVLLGAKYQETIDIIHVLIYVPVIICISNLLIVQTIIPLGREKILLYIYSIVSICYFSLSYFFVKYYSYIGMAYSVLAVELLVIIFAYTYLKRTNIF